MLDTIVYIPTILAYTFITLLIVILGFIVIYISHKIYISVYDNLQIPDLRSSFAYSTDKVEHFRKTQPPALEISKNTSLNTNVRKAKTVQR